MKHSLKDLCSACPCPDHVPKLPQSFVHPEFYQGFEIGGTKIALLVGWEIFPLREKLIWVVAGRSIPSGCWLYLQWWGLLLRVLFSWTVVECHSPDPWVRCLIGGELVGIRVELSSLSQRERKELLWSILHLILAWAHHTYIWEQTLFPKLGRTLNTSSSIFFVDRFSYCVLQKVGWKWLLI